MSKKINDSISLIKKNEKLALQYNDFGYHLAFSGGKDSQVIYELCKIAEVKFKAFFYKTTVDPPELLKFISKNYSDVIVLKPEMTMFQLIEKKGMLPLRQARFCCDYLKERKGLNAVVITGITKVESTKREKRNSFETSCKLGQDKVLLNPILEWTEKDVYGFLKEKNIEICSLYETQERIGCIGCPENTKMMRSELEKYPQFRKAYLNAVEKLRKKGKYSQFKNSESVINWWTSGLNRRDFLNLEKQLNLFEDN